MVLRHRYRRKTARIEMVPLIDIVFLLLVFFIYAMLSMAVHRGMNVELPKSAIANVSEDAPLSVSILYVDGETAIYVDRAKVSLEELERRLRTQASEVKDTRVLLFADKSVSYQQLYTVLDRVSSAGISAISLQSEQKR